MVGTSQNNSPLHRVAGMMAVLAGLLLSVAGPAYAQDQATSIPVKAKAVVPNVESPDDIKTESNIIPQAGALSQNSPLPVTASPIWAGGGDELASDLAEPEHINPDLPNLLIIGDTISIGYTLPLRKLLDGKYNVYRIPNNGRSTNYGKMMIDQWLGNRHWDVIVFNWGGWDTIHTELKAYKANLLELTKRLEQTRARLVFATTTPAPPVINNFLGERVDYDNTVENYNLAAGEVMKEQHVPCIDLHGLVLPDLDSLQRPQDYRFTPTGSQFLAKGIAEAVTDPEKLVPSLKAHTEQLEYYMIVFACQAGEANPLTKSHTWATFVSATPEKRLVKQITISWLPFDLVIEPFEPVPVMGKNLGLKETIEWAIRGGAQVTKWGPYRIERSLFESAKRRAYKLEHGKARYLILDKRWRATTGHAAYHCIHAVSDIGGFLATGGARGVEASEMVVQHFRRWILPDDSDKQWIEFALGLPRYPIIDK